MLGRLVTMSGEDHVQLVPMFGAGVSPRDSVLGLGVEEGVGDTEVVLGAELQQTLSVFVHFPDAEFPEARSCSQCPLWH